MISPYMDGKANSVRFLVTVSEALFGPLPSREPEGLRRGFDALSGARPFVEMVMLWGFCLGLT